MIAFSFQQEKTFQVAMRRFIATKRHCNHAKADDIQRYLINKPLSVKGAYATRLRNWILYQGLWSFKRQRPNSEILARLNVKRSVREC